MSSSEGSTPSKSWKDYLRIGTMILTPIAAAALYVVAFWKTSTYLGNTTTYNQIQDVVRDTWMYSIIGCVLLFIGSVLYLLQDQQYAVYVILFLSFIGLGLSYAALAISTITK